MMATKVKPNTLVQYKGGGYEGCFWEWNYAFIDNNGKFNCIVATGYSGCKTEEELQKILEKDGTYLYDFNADEGIKEFCVESNVDHVIGVAKWLKENNVDITLVTVCDECGESATVLDCEAEGISCCGGIVYQHDKTICHDCHEAGSCHYCGEYVSPERIHPETGFCHDKTLKGEWVEGCGWCHEEHGEE